MTLEASTQVSTEYVSAVSVKFTVLMLRLSCGLPKVEAHGNHAWNDLFTVVMYETAIHTSMASMYEW